MSAIDDKIKKLREQEKQLELEKLKVEFLNHILTSAKDYNHKAFAEVKADVVALLEKFVQRAIQSIETGNSEYKPAEPPSAQPNPNAPPVVQPIKKPAPAPGTLSAADKLDFALAHRHLGNKRVSVANDQNINVHGVVVGLDAPNVVVKTDTGPTINVPIGKVSLL